MPFVLLARKYKYSRCYIASANIVISLNSIQFYLYSNWNCLESLYRRNIHKTKFIVTTNGVCVCVRGIDAELLDQFRDEASYWREVLRRIVAVIMFLSERGLAFRGDNEILGSVHNGNYLGISELLSKFDPFLDEHLKQYGNKGWGTTSYLSSTIYEEFISLMGQRVQAEIILQLQKAKYFSLIVDSTPDLSHIDQLTLVVHYVSQEDKV